MLIKRRADRDTGRLRVTYKQTQTTDLHHEEINDHVCTRRAEAIKEQLILISGLMIRAKEELLQTAKIHKKKITI